MKLRIRHNALRLRLGRSEVERLRHGDGSREAICFPEGNRLEYTLEPSADNHVSVSLAGFVVRVKVPAGNLAEWCDSEEVGISADLPVPGDLPLSLLIEKDFRCLDPEISEDQSDTFDNPQERHASCEPGA